MENMLNTHSAGFRGRVLSCLDKVLDLGRVKSFYFSLTIFSFVCLFVLDQEAATIKFVPPHTGSDEVCFFSGWLVYCKVSCFLFFTCKKMFSFFIPEI